jgi:hypothetical protein
MIIENLVHVEKEVEQLREVLDQWVVLLFQMYHETNGDHTPYSYKERTNIGVFANAATLAGWNAMEECASSKQREKGGEVYDGRIDLMLWKSDKIYLFESKLTANSPCKLRGRINSVLKKARVDAERLTATPGIGRLASVFVIPRFPEATPASDVAKEIKQVIGFCKEHKPNFFAYTFPGYSARKSLDREDNGMCAYGAILMGFRV